MADTPKTSYYNIGRENDRPVTPTDLTPAQLLEGLQKQGVRLVAFADGEHKSIRVKEQFNSALEGSKQPTQMMFVEWTSRHEDQEAVDAFLKKDSGAKELKALKERVTPESNAFAPSEDEPKARKEYFAAWVKQYELAKSKDMKVILADERHPGKHERFVKLHNRAVSAQRNFSIVSRIFSEIEDDEDKRSKLTIASLGDKLDKETKTDLRDYIESLPDSDKKAYDEYTFAEIEKMAQAQISAARKERIAAENDRDIWRDKMIAPSVLKSLGEDGTGVIMFGARHFGEKVEGRSEPNLEDFFRKDLGGKFARIDIIPVSPDELAVMSGKEGQKQIVAIGGAKGADYTIFVAEDDSRYQYNMERTKVVDVEKGPHKDTIKLVEKFATPEKKDQEKKEPAKKDGSAPSPPATMPDLSALNITGDKNVGESGFLVPTTLTVAKAPKTRNDPFEIS